MTVAESAFVNAIIKVIDAQIQMYDLSQTFEQLDEQAQRANEAVLKEKGFDNDTPVSTLLAEQEAFLEAAIERGDFPAGHPVLEILRGQFDQARESFDAWQTEQMKGIKGPAL